MHVQPQAYLKGMQGRVHRGAQGVEHPPKVWHNSQLSSCVTIIIHKQLLVA